MGRRGKIFVIDDDPTLCATVRRALQSLHDVEVFTSGKDAIAKLREGANVDVILCDLTMPEIGGADVFAEVQRLSPELSARIIFSTGGAFTEESRQFLDHVANRQLAKPFDVPQLRAVVSEAVERVS